MFIYPYKTGSESARALSIGLGARRIRHEGSAFKGSPDKVVINWGSSSLPDEVMKCNVINPPEVTGIASNKLKFFKAISEYNRSLYDYEDCVNIPIWTDDIYDVECWLDGGSIVVARQLLTGNSGAGIVIVEHGDEIPAAPLYVRYVPKKQEYRVHVANGVVVDTQRKARRQDVPNEQVNWRVRNHDNGFIYARNDLVVPGSVHRQAINACKAINLDFGAVDIIFNERRGEAYVLEINTSPGLAGTTLEGYVERFKTWEGQPQ